MLEEVIAKVEADAQNGRHVLAKVMQVSDTSQSFIGDWINIRCPEISECRWHVIPSSPGAEKGANERTMNWMRRRGRRGGYVASALEVCSGFSAAVPVRAGSGPPG